MVDSYSYIKCVYVHVSVHVHVCGLSVQVILF